MADEQMRCARCKRFIGEDCLEGWTGGLFGDYNDTFYCAAGRGCNADDKPTSFALKATAPGGEAPIDPRLA